MFRGVEGHNGIDTEPVELFKGIKGAKGRNFYPSDLSVEEFHNIIQTMLEQGKDDEVRKIFSVRTMVRRDGNLLKAIDYTEYFADSFSKIANELEVAAHYTTDNDFKEFLSWQAQALIQNNEDMDMLADKHWAELQNNNQLEFTIGRESYDDEMSPSVYDNPKLLKINEEFELDNMAKYVVVIDKNISQTKVDNEDVNILKVKEIVITNFYYQNEGFDDMRFGDLTFFGKLKSIIALFVPKFRLQM
jgi:hypothetical protein